LNFGNQPVGTKSLPQKITMSNKGSSAVSITSISITGTNAGDFAQTRTCGNSLASGASCFITITFKPLAKGKRTAVVSASDNGGGSPQTASLAGTGT
jgi:trimeric autotransporter adhesin